MILTSHVTATTDVIAAASDKTEIEGCQTAAVQQCSSARLARKPCNAPLLLLLLCCLAQCSAPNCTALMPFFGRMPAAIAAGALLAICSSNCRSTRDNSSTEAAVLPHAAANTASDDAAAAESAVPAAADKVAATAT